MERRIPGVLVLGCCVVTATALAVHGRAEPPQGGAGVDTGSVYAWTGWVLLAVLAGAGAFLLLRPQHDRLGAAVVAVGAVVAVQLAGTGAVALRHWSPYSGMSGSVGNLAEVEALAAAMALAAVFALAILVVELFRSVGLRSDALPGRMPRRILVGIGLLVVVALPWALADGNPEMTDATSLGALALLFSLPWGLSLVATAWLPRGIGLVVSLAVLASVLLELVGPDMKDLIFSDTVPGLVAALVAVAVAVAVQAVRALSAQSSPGRPTTA